MIRRRRPCVAGSRPQAIPNMPRAAQESNEKQGAPLCPSFSGGDRCTDMQRLPNVNDVSGGA